MPVCPACGGRIKPDVVLYEEPLDEHVLTGAVAAIAAADALIVGGTSLVVVSGRRALRVTLPAIRWPYATLLPPIRMQMPTC